MSIPISETVSDRRRLVSAGFGGVLALCALCTVSTLGLPARAQGEADGAELFQQSYDHESAGKLQEALGDLDGLSAQRKDGYVTQLRRGWLLYRLGQHDKAIEWYKRAIESEPKAVEPRIGILLPLQALRRWTDAETTAKEVLKVDANNYLGALRLAYAEYNLHKYPISAGIYRKLKELYPSDVEVRSGLGWALLKSGKAAEAASEFREILSISPRHALAREGLTAAAATAGR